MALTIVVGLGRSGVGAARLLHHQGESVVVIEKGESDSLRSQAESLRLVGLGATWTRCSRLGSLRYTTNFTSGSRLLLLQFNKLFLEVIDLRLHLLNLLSNALVHLLGHGLLDEFRYRITHILRDSSE